MELVPREIFAPRRFTDLARKDVALPLPCGQTMTAPRTVASMLVALGVEPHHRVLEIGTGSGYVTALLARLGREVVSVERFGTLAESAVGHLAAAGIAKGVRIETGDGIAPRPRERFDRILVNGAAPAIPSSLASLLAPEGRLVGALTVEGIPRLHRADRTAQGDLREELGGALRLSPLLSGVAQACDGAGRRRASTRRSSIVATIPALRKDNPPQRQHLFNLNSPLIRPSSLRTGGVRHE